MGITSTRLALTKLYLASFSRAPEASGLEYWDHQLTSGKSLADVVTTIYSLDVVKALYPDAMSDVAFLTAIYNNLFGSQPDPARLLKWAEQFGNGYDRSHLVMTMFDAGLAAPDCTPAKAHLVNRLASATQAVERQLAQGVEIVPRQLAEIMSTVDRDPGSVNVASEKIDRYTGTKIVGTVADGYIKGATVFADANRNAVWDEGEATTTTDDAGNFTLTNAKGALVVTGGTYVATNLAHHGVLTAPFGSRIVSILTTLQQRMVEQGKSPADAQAAVSKALGLSSAVNLQECDPLAAALSLTATSDEKATAVKLQANVAKVENVVVLATRTLFAAAGPSVTSNEAANAVITSLVNIIINDNDGLLSLSEQNFLKDLLTDSTVATSNEALRAAAGKVNDMSSSFAVIMAELAAHVDGALSASRDALRQIALIVQVQSASQGTVAAKIASAAADGALSHTLYELTGAALTQLVHDADIWDLVPGSTWDNPVIEEVNSNGRPSEGGDDGDKGPSAPSFGVVNSGGVITFNGDATGPITVTQTGGIVTFFRGGAAATGVFDLSSVTTKFSLSAGQTLVGPLSLLNGVAAEGDGAVQVTHFSGATAMKLSRIRTASVVAEVVTAAHAPSTLDPATELGKASIHVTGTGTLDVGMAALGTATFTIDANAKVTGTAVALSGRYLVGSGTVAVTELEAAPGADLSHIDAAMVSARIMTTTTPVNLDPTTKLGKARILVVGNGIFDIGGAPLDLATFTVDAMATVRGKASALTGKAVTGPGAVEVVALDEIPEADLSHIVAASVTASAENDMTFRGQLGAAEVVVAANKTFTIAASLASGKTITGAGSMTVTGTGDAFATVDFSRFSVQGRCTFDASDDEVVLDLPQADALTEAGIAFAANDRIHLFARADQLYGLELSTYRTGALGGADLSFTIGFAPTDIGIWLDGVVQAKDKIDLSAFTTEVAATALTGSLSIESGRVYFLSTDRIGGADSIGAATAAIDAAATIDDRPNTAYVIIVDDDSTSIFQWVGDGQGDGANGDALILVGSIDEGLQTTNLLFV